MRELDNVIHQPVRLRIMSSLGALEPEEQVDFVCLRKILKLTDGNLSVHLSKLEAAGYIRIEKTFIDRKPRTFIGVTGRGRDAFDEYVGTLKEIIAGSKSNIKTRK